MRESEPLLLNLLEDVLSELVQGLAMIKVGLALASDQRVGAVYEGGLIQADLFVAFHLLI